MARSASPGTGEWSEADELPGGGGGAGSPQVVPEGAALYAAPVRTDRPVPLAPGLVRVTAANPGVMTGPGTNSYLVGTDEVVVVDPGPDDPAHLDAIEAAAGGSIRWLVVTHTHRDHAPGAAELARRTGALRLGFASRDGFEADRLIGDGFELCVPGAVLRAVHTPGHASNHLCFVWERSAADEGRTADEGRAAGSTAGEARTAGGRAGIEPAEGDGSAVPGAGLRRVLLSGDHVMQGSTVVIAPPDGDMATYLASLRLVRDLVPPVDAIAPGHGRLIDQPKSVIDGIVGHRLAREGKVAGALAAAGSATVDGLLPAVYDDVDPERHPIARRSLWAHLRKLAADGRATAGDPDDEATTWVWSGP